MDIVIGSCLALLAVVWLGVVVVGPPYVPTLRRDLRQVLETLGVGKGDYLVDLGAGDGRVLVAAARRGARVSGVELNPFLALLAGARVRRYGGRVVLGDMWRYRLPDDTTHVFAFAAGAFMNKLERYLVDQRTHTGQLTVICYGFHFKGRTPEKVVGAFNLYRF